LTGGETSAPLDVYLAGMAPPLLNARLDTLIDAAAIDSC